MVKLLFLPTTLISGSYLADEHYSSLLLGFYISALAVSSCYWFALRSTRFPQLALALLVLGLFAKIAVTAVGISVSASLNLISSPFIFSLSYLFFSIAVTYLSFTYRDAIETKRFYDTQPS